MLPTGLLPMLATAGPLPRGAAWAYELKWDGYRVLAAVGGSGTTLRSRTGRDVTSEYPEIHLEGLPDCLVDGELVALVDGRPSFNALQLHDVPVTFVPFDLLHLQDASLLELPWTARRELLTDLLPEAPPVFEDGDALLDTTRSQGLEGVVAKRKDSRYFPGRRTESWVKVKHVRRQSAVVLGWKAGEGRRAGEIGSLLLGVPSADGFVFVGHVGTGFSDRTLTSLRELLAPLVRPTPACVNPPPAATWVEPVVVVDVDFTSWTPDGKLRHPTYKGVRDDLDPSQVVRE